MSRDGSASRLHHIRGRSHASFGPFCDIALCLLQKVRSRVISRLHMLAASCCLPDRCCRTRDFVGISEQHRFKITNKRATLIQIAIRLDSFVSNFDFTFLLRILFRQYRPERNSQNGQRHRARPIQRSLISCQVPSARIAEIPEFSSATTFAPLPFRTATASGSSCNNLGEWTSWPG